MRILNLSLVVFIVMNCAVNAQITITGADMPQAGTTFLLGNDTTTAVSLGSPGASSQTWNFSTISNDYYKVADYGLTLNTPYASDFPTSNIHTYGPSAYYSTLYGGAPVDESSNGYMFWKSDATGFWAVGFRADDGPYSNMNVYMVPPELLIGAPASYDSTFTNDSRWELALNLNSSDADTFYIVNRSKTINVDAWGELITPYGTFSVIRYHQYYTEQDSVRYEVSSPPSNTTFFQSADTGNIYTYMANGIGYPVAIVHADKDNNVKSVEYLLDTTYTSIEAPQALNDASIYPNPTNGILTLSLSVNPVHGELTVYNVTGKRVTEIISVTQRVNQLDFSNLPEGIYLYRLLDDKGMIRSGRFIKN